MAKIKVLVPQYVKEFQCIGGDCEDTCCQYWDITVDKKTYKKYKKLGKKEFNPLFNKNIVRNKENEGMADYARICMEEDGCCPFLREDKLCGIYQKLSYDYMPLTCRLYPRFTHQIDDVIEMGLSLSCPEAARKALLSEEIMEFEFVEFEIEEYMEWKSYFLYTQGVNVKKAEHAYFWDIRMAAIDILQNRRFTIVERLMLLGMMYKRIQGCIDVEKYENISVQIDDLVKLVKDINPRELFSGIQKNKEIQFFISKLITGRNGLGKKESISQKLKELFLGTQRVFGMEEGNLCLNIQNLDLYKKYLNRVNSFIEDNPHIFENYLVNLYFIRCMPFSNDFDAVWDDLIYLCMQYLILKSLMIGNLYNKQRITQEDMIEIIYLIGKNFEHSMSYVNLMVESSKIFDLNTLGGLYVLIHD